MQRTIEITDQQLDTRTQTPRVIPTEQQDEQEQERMRQAYLLQQQRLACPGCGETPFLG